MVLPSRWTRNTLMIGNMLLYLHFALASELHKRPIKTKGCNSDGCIQMAEDNCKAAPEAFLTCPCAYLWYGCVHCGAVIARAGDKPKRASDLNLDKEMREKDKLFEDKHTLGCLFCPCFLSALALGIVGMVMTWLGSASCCIAGLCCKSCKNNKVANSSDIENQIELKTIQEKENN